MDTYLITVDDDITVNKRKGIGMQKIAYTSRPAIETMGVAFNKQMLKNLYFQSEVEQKIAGPLMIPMDIYRIEEDGYEYNVKFTEESIAKIHETFMLSLNNQDIFNVEHNNEIIVDSFITEIWIVEDPKTDKSFTKFNIEVPKGTLFAVTKVKDKNVYDELVNQNRIGFSIEGVLGLSLQEFTNKNKNKNIKMEENTLKLPTGEHTIGDKIYVVDEAGSIVEIKDVVPADAQMAEPATTEEKKEEPVTEPVAAADPATEPDEKPVEKPVEEKKETEMAEPTSITEEQVLAMIQPKLDEIYKMIADLKGELETDDDADEMKTPVAMNTDNSFELALSRLIRKG